MCTPWRATADLRDGSTQSILEADGIVSGVAIAIEGQSNSIFNDATLAPSPFARTFGSNNGRSASDTVFKTSIASGNGGGANVGAWGLRMQNLLAEEQGMPSCVINGGVGGTRIELHFPNEANHQALNTIYGSWLYRIDKSGLREHIRWLFWYQGESNSGSDGYADLFGTLYSAWKEDLPNLEHIVVVQIRPGCGGTEHALLRDDQRRLQDLYDDVVVHTACALPGHDGCHFRSAGYRQLGDQMYRLYRDMEDGFEVPTARAPTIHRVRQDVSTGVITITTKYASSLLVTDDGGRPLSAAFFLNGQESLNPDEVWIEGSTIVLRPPAGITPTTVSYVPSKNDAATNALFQGPWLTDEVGVGLLSFHDVPVIASSVDEENEHHAIDRKVVKRGQVERLHLDAHGVSCTTIHGNPVSIESGEGWYRVPEQVAPGPYALTIQHRNWC